MSNTVRFLGLALLAGMIFSFGCAAKKPPPPPPPKQPTIEEELACNEEWPVPPKGVISVATWHLGRLDDNKPLDGIDKIADVIMKFDAITLQGIRSTAAVDRIAGRLKTKGKEYLYAVSDPTEDGWYYAWFIRASDGEILLEPKLAIFGDCKPFKRCPQVLRMKIGAFDFDLLAVDIDKTSDYKREMKAIAVLYNYFQGRNGSEGDVILAGDMAANTKTPEFSEAMLDLPGVIVAVDTDVITEYSKDGSKGRTTDNMLFQSGPLREYAGKCGIGPAEKDSPSTAYYVKNVAKHRPVWVFFRVDDEDDD